MRSKLSQYLHEDDIIVVPCLYITIMDYLKRRLSSFMPTPIGLFLYRDNQVSNTNKGCQLKSFQKVNLTTKISHLTPIHLQYSEIYLQYSEIHLQYSEIHLQQSEIFLQYSEIFLQYSEICLQHIAYNTVLPSCCCYKFNNVDDLWIKQKSAPNDALFNYLYS